MNLKSVTATLPASDFERAKSWYADKLGLKPTQEDMGGATYNFNGSSLLLYPSEFAGTNKATAAGFDVDDVSATVEELRGAGVTFEEYDLPELKTENGIATFEDQGTTLSVAWFKDSEDNIIAITGS
jgi:catechol 2,3-dioxygenase-like lactoylglutathione lyase family enzyme